MQKSADAFRTISEVAEELDVPQHVLRFWESKFTQIKPLKRAGGRRYYRPDDISLLRGIRGLLYSDGYTIKGVQKLLKERGARAVSGGVNNNKAAAHRPAMEKPDSGAASPAGGASPKRRGAAPDPDEMPLPFFMPDFLKAQQAPASAAKSARIAGAPGLPPAHHKKLEKLLAELVKIQDLLKGA